LRRRRGRGERAGRSSPCARGHETSNVGETHVSPTSSLPFSQTRLRAVWLRRAEPGCAKYGGVTRVKAAAYPKIRRVRSPAEGGTYGSRSQPDSDRRRRGARLGRSHEHVRGRHPHVGYILLIV